MYDRLWILDDGKVYNNTGAENIVSSCPSNLQIYDLNTDKLLVKYEFGPELVSKVS